VSHVASAAQQRRREPAKRKGVNSGMSDAINFPLSGDSQEQQIPADAEASASQLNISSGASGRSERDAPKSPMAAAAAKAAAFLCAPDRRRRRRALISAPVRVRGVQVTDHECPDEISVTIDVSRAGLLFLAQQGQFRRGMDVAVTFPYSNAPTAIHAEQSGRVARVVEMSDGRCAVAVALGKQFEQPSNYDFVDSCGRRMIQSPEPVVGTAESPAGTKPASATAPGTLPTTNGARGPLVLVVDADNAIREALKTYLCNEGYEVIAVNNCADAREILNMFTPALIIAEVEGEGLPGFDLCAHVKTTRHLKHIPVVLTTRSGYPSDYSNAHSLGAVVCMAKPYKQERLGHVVRLLAPTERAKMQPGPAPRPAPAPRPKCSEPARKSWFRLS